MREASNWHSKLYKKWYEGYINPTVGFPLSIGSD